MSDQAEIEKEKPLSPNEAPLYNCHKQVRAFKIEAINQISKEEGDPTPDAQLIPFDKDISPVTVSGEYMDKHSPYNGGYYVVYDEGYESFSPAEAFEKGYSLAE